MINTARQRTQAEIKKLEADTAYTKALTRKVNAETQAIKIENDKTRKAADSLLKESKIIKTVSTQSGVSLDQTLGEVS